MASGWGRRDTKFWKNVISLENYSIDCNFGKAITTLNAGTYFFFFFAICYFKCIEYSKNTKSNHGELLRTIGFSSAPGLIRVFGVTPDLMTVTFIGSAFWMLACMVVAVKSALDYDSIWKSLGVVVVAWFIQAFFLFLVLVLFKGV